MENKTIIIYSDSEAGQIMKQEIAAGTYTGKLHDVDVDWCEFELDGVVYRLIEV